MKEILQTQKPTYETPTIEVVTFALEESIATSGDFGSATLCGEEIY